MRTGQASSGTPLQHAVAGTPASEQLPSGGERVVTVQDIGQARGQGAEPGTGTPAAAEAPESPGHTQAASARSTDPSRQNVSRRRPDPPPMSIVAPPGYVFVRGANGTAALLRENDPRAEEATSENRRDRTAQLPTPGTRERRAYNALERERQQIHEAARAAHTLLDQIELGGYDQAARTEVLRQYGFGQASFRADQLLNLAIRGEAHVRQRIAEMEASIQRATAVTTGTANLQREPDDPINTAYNQWIRARARHVHGMQYVPSRASISEATDAYRTAVQSFYGPTHQAAAMFVSDDTSGGYLAPPEFINELIRLLQEQNPVRGLCRRYRIGASSLEVPRQTAHATAMWVGERQDGESQDLDPFGMREIFTHEQYAEVHVSQKNLQDTRFDLEAYIKEDMMEQLMRAESYAFTNGDGHLKPMGAVNMAGVKEITTEAAGKIQADDLLNIYFDLLSAYAANATWVLKRTSVKAVAKLKNNEGDYYWHPGVSGDPRGATILNAPYREADGMPDIVQNAFPIMWGDWRSGYCCVDRTDVGFLDDPITSKKARVLEISATKRVGGDGWNPAALVKLKIK